MPVDPDLLDLLACPSDDHAPLREHRHEGGDALICTHCATVYRVDDGIPVLLLDEATPGPNGIGVAAGSGAPGALDERARRPQPGGPATP